MFARARIESFGWQPFYRRPVRRRLLSVLEAGFPMLMPQLWGLGEGPPTRFDRERFEHHSIGPGPMVMELVRDEAPAWKIFLSLSDRAWLSASAPAETLRAIGAEAWFALADSLAEALEPDLACAHLDAELSALPEGERRQRALIDSGVTTAYEAYETGPAGPAMRSWFGPRLARRIGETRLIGLSSPAVLRRAAGGSFVMDLLPEPWRAEPRALAEAYDHALRCLAPSGVFTRPLGDDRGGVARESPFGLRLQQDARANGPAPDELPPDPAPLLSVVRDHSCVEDLTLSWVDLRGVDLCGLQADGLDLSWAELDEAKLNDARLVAVEFESGALTRTSFDGSTLLCCGFARAVAPDSNWRGVRVEQTEFTRAVFERAVLTGAELTECSFDEATVDDATFAGARLKGVSFRGAECRRTSFAGAVLVDVDFEGADLSGADFTGAVLERVNIEDARHDGKPSLFDETT